MAFFFAAVIDLESLPVVGCVIITSYTGLSPLRMYSGTVTDYDSLSPVLVTEGCVRNFSDKFGDMARASLVKTFKVTCKSQLTRLEFQN